MAERFRLDAVEQPIAEDVWFFTDQDGQSRRTKIVVGKPQPHPEGDYYTPVFVEAHMTRPQAIMGVGPVDSLINATELVRRLFENSSWEPRSTE